MDLPQMKEKDRGLGRVESITVFTNIQFCVCVCVCECVRERETETERQRDMYAISKTWSEISTYFLFSTVLEPICVSFLNSVQ